MSDQLAFVEEERHEDRVVLRVSGEIDLSNVEPLQARIDRAAEGRPLVVVDLAAVEYIDSQGLRLLKRLSNTLAGRGARLEVVAPPQSIARDVLDMTRMGDDFAVRDALDG
jgi:anti-sigma B factor antagonist